MHALRRRTLLALPLAGGLARAQRSAPPEVREALGEARLQGEGRLRFLGLSIYEIRCWTTQALSAEAALQQPLALEIAYQRALVGSLIAERSLTEMQRGGPLDEATGERWLARMKQLFPDVQAGDRITGLHQPGQGARFYLNGRATGEVADAAFARRFFGIWLAPHTSEPALRQQLLGLSR